MYFCTLNPHLSNKMVSKTREKLIEVARQLFAYKGMENTTMSDIANASDKGRRTIYTYFKNKKEIYRAVLEKESEHLVERLRAIVDSDLNPTEKLMKFIDMRLDILRENINHQRATTNWRAFLVGEMKRVERVRSLAGEKELAMLKRILKEGQKSGDFLPENVPGAYTSLIILFQGIEISVVRNQLPQFGLEFNLMKQQLKQLILTYLKQSN